MFKPVISIVLALTLCIGICGFAYAEESELSIDDILGLLSSLSGTDDTDGADAALEDMTSYTLGEVSFSLPSTWEVTEDEDYIEASSSDFADFISASYISSGFGVYDITDPSFIETLEEASGQTYSESEVFYIGEYPAIKLVSEVSSGDLGEEDLDISALSTMLFIAVGDAGFNLSAYSFNGDNSTFNAILDTITIGSAPAADPVPDDGTGTAAAVDPDAIDVAALGGEAVLVDNDVCTVSMKKFSEEDDYYGLVGTIFTENKTDLNLRFRLDNVCVNGYMCEPYWSATVSAGHKANNEISFYKEDLEMNGITAVREISFTLRAYDDDDWSSDDVLNETFTIYPFGTDVPEQPEQVFGDDALVIVDNDDITMILTGFDTDSYYLNGHVFIENKTDIPLEFSVGDTTAINGYEISPYFYRDVPAGKKTNTVIDWSLSDLETNDITTIEEIELDISVSDAENWSADPIFTDLYTVTFE